MNRHRRDVQKGRIADADGQIHMRGPWHNHQGLRGQPDPVTGMRKPCLACRPGRVMNNQALLPDRITGRGQQRAINTMSALSLTGTERKASLLAQTRGLLRIGGRGYGKRAEAQRQLRAMGREDVA